MSRTTMLWLLWIALTVPTGLFVLAVILYGGNRSFLLIGKTTHGHHQIELACDACHASVFGGPEVLQEACVGCHGAELKAANDTHPISKFLDPRNADRLAALDARYCVTCHQEHRPGITRAMGVTLPEDYCFHCHQDIAKERPSHEGLAFATCASAGCHNYHDNRALYESFLRDHAKQPLHLDKQLVALADWLAEKDSRTKAGRPLTAADADTPAEYKTDDAIIVAWASDVHAAAGINCSGCHTTKAEPDKWIAAPSLDTCQSCHADQARTFTEGKHGMRLRKGLVASRVGPLGLWKEHSLAPMTPAEARLPMKADAHGTALGCNTCHSAHKYEFAAARVEACTSCHDDPHTKAYFSSPHYELFKKELAGELSRGAGVTCATCHMPVHEERRPGGSRARFVNHNQNDNLRPNEKMVRSVCAHCHGLQFTLDALADPALIQNNFTGSSTIRIESIDWALRRAKERKGARQ